MYAVYVNGKHLATFFDIKNAIKGIKAAFLNVKDGDDRPAFPVALIVNAETNAVLRAVVDDANGIHTLS